MSNIKVNHIELSFDDLIEANCIKKKKGKPILRVEDETEDDEREADELLWSSSSGTVSSAEFLTVLTRKEVEPKTLEDIQGDCSKGLSKQNLESEQRSSHASTDIPYAHGSKASLDEGWQTKKPCARDLPVPGPYNFIGNCGLDYKKMAGMSLNRLKFFITQDPRKKSCIRNPDARHYQPPPRPVQNAALEKKVREAENICMPPKTKSKTIVCEVVDVRNPLGLDFQGMDYQTTYRRDEQTIVNEFLNKGVARHMDKARVKRAAPALGEEYLRKERLRFPDEYGINEWAPKTPTPPPEKIPKTAEVFHTEGKPGNKERLEAEKEGRRKRYKDLYLQKKARDDQMKEKQKREEQEAEKLAGFHTAIKVFDSFVDKEKKRTQPPPVCEITALEAKKRQKFPHTLQETHKLRAILKKKNIIYREVARVRKEFFKERTGKDKGYPEADLELSSESETKSEAISCDSHETDDLDDIEVGRRGSRIFLRGFHDRLSNNVRGKGQEPELKKPRGCLTREEWMQQLAPKRLKTVVDIQRGAREELNPDHPNYELFPTKFGVTRPKVEESAVRKYIRKRLGLQYFMPKERIIKVAKPRLPYGIKRFNMISYIFGEQTKMDRLSVGADLLHIEKRELKTTEEYRIIRKQLQQQEYEYKKKMRLKLLGIPYTDFNVYDVKTPCDVQIGSRSSSSDWNPVPSQDEESKPRLPRAQRGNMPAPKQRENTLRSHPRHPRQYAIERVPSQILHEEVKKTHIPHLHKMAPDVRIFANIKDEVPPYVKALNGRHHHDYWDPVQMQEAKVLFQPKVVHAQATVPPKEPPKLLPSSFKEAQPLCNAFIQMDLTQTQTDPNSLNAAKGNAMRKSTDGDDLHHKRRGCKGTKDFVFSTRDPQEMEDLDYPGRKEYLEFLAELRNDLYDWGQPVVDETGEKIHIDKQMLITDLEDELRSIESCLTSLSSSTCTNLSNDSGSVLLVEDNTHIPLDYIRKAVIPFEELKHSRFKIEVIREDKNKPYKVVPREGLDKNAEKKDNFFTYTTRLCNGLRLRLETPFVDVRNVAIGYAKKKFPGLVATDLDEFFVQVLNINNPHDRELVRFKSEAGLAKDILRLKYEIMVIQGQIVRFKIWHQLNVMNYQHLRKTKKMMEMLFNKWRKRVYDATLAIMSQTKYYYVTTDLLRVENETLKHEYTELASGLIFSESEWCGLVQLQNFHYLFAPMEWRVENDWIHRINDDESSMFESYEVSIDNRSTANIRKREDFSAKSIVNYFLMEYFPNKKPPLDAFKNAEDFQAGIEQLKKQTFLYLRGLHYTISEHMEVARELTVFKNYVNVELKAQEEFVYRKCSKKYFMEASGCEVIEKFDDLLYIDLPKYIEHPVINTMDALVTLAWCSVVPVSVRGSATEKLKSTEKMAMIGTSVLEMLAEFEQLSLTETAEVEHNIRKTRERNSKISRKAYFIEKRVQAQVEAIKRGLAPVFKPKPRVGKLQAVWLKKKFIPPPKIMVPPIPFTRLTQLRAFSDGIGLSTKQSRQKSLEAIDASAQDLIPFYFDHFLELNGYKPDYSFKTTIDFRDGPEENFMHRTELIPEIEAKMEKWLFVKEKVRKENIKKTPEMYTNLRS